MLHDQNQYPLIEEAHSHWLSSARGSKAVTGGRTVSATAQMPIPLLSTRPPTYCGSIHSSCQPPSQPRAAAMDSPRAGRPYETVAEPHTGHDPSGKFRQESSGAGSVETRAGPLHRECARIAGRRRRRRFQRRLRFAALIPPPLPAPCSLTDLEHMTTHDLKHYLEVRPPSCSICASLGAAHRWPTNRRRHLAPNPQQTTCRACTPACLPASPRGKTSRAQWSAKTC